MDILNAGEVPFSIEREMWLESFGVLTRDQMNSTVAMPNLRESETRYNVAAARFQVLRMAAAARYRWLVANAFPATAADFRPLLPAPPLDPFTSAPLRFISTPESCTVYSVGPDGGDDRAAVAYDPTNGTVSRGDLFTVVPRERRYPFPAGGVRANTPGELLAQFPHGLPSGSVRKYPRPSAQSRRDAAGDGLQLGAGYGSTIQPGRAWPPAIAPGARL